ncbi:hypothetical protein [Lacinutrix sp. Bg11-31]|uniref:hypothetical protein n=1 Tax=Lacinutrix sp. Bg11-31 TaxID=2057808 RepID=UPI000C30147D|nr:hypothetical protein [Lacinutrix sp. Bg11-31]AUC82202.1 hypothetical protein CW733_08695 [Lacinutrix sp. Bg11-31]
MEKLNEKQLLVARQEFKPFLTMTKKGVSKLKLKTPLSLYKQQFNTSFESLGCVGYNSTFKQLTATINIKRQTGYSGGLCTNGSFEYVRFYMNYQEGDGWEDMGYVGVNVHDIPTQKDCSNKDEKPINYTVRLNISPKKKSCNIANLPLVRAVLSWSTIPAANDPELTNGTYVWSDKKEVQVQIEPLKLFIPDFPIFELDDLFNTALLNPELSINAITNLNPNLINTLQKAKKSIAPKAYNFAELNQLYKKEKFGPQRFGHKLLQQVESEKELANITEINDLFELNDFNLSDVLVNWNQLECNTDFEELLCVGADYNQEALVGTLKIKKPSGYSGNLCSTGSREYVSFWIQTEENCQWKHAGTTFVSAYDIADIPSDGIHYSVVLPYNFDELKQDCENPQVLKVRAILSWNTSPQGFGCSNYGNVVESYIQLQKALVSNGPKLVSVGGVSTDFINNVDGLTLAGAKFGFTMNTVTSGSAFAKKIIIQGLATTYAGQSYKIKTTNLDTGEVKYVNNTLVLEGHNNVTGSVIYTTVIPVNDVYTYIGGNKNTYSVIANFSPGTNNRLLIELEHLGVAVDSQIIQMDNQAPILTLNIDDYGDCSHFSKGIQIKGNFDIQEAHLSTFVLRTTATDVNQTLSSSIAGDNPFGDFEFTASTIKNCGNIILSAKPKTVVDSVVMHPGTSIAPNICLSDN